MTGHEQALRQKYVAAGIAAGVGAGVAIGIALGNLALGIGPGIALGVAFGLMHARRVAARQNVGGSARGDDESTGGA